MRACCQPATFTVIFLNEEGEDLCMNGEAILKIVALG